MSLRSERKERSHAAILDAAAAAVRRHGIAGARVADVMEAAGLTVGGFYAHFPSKEQLVDEALRHSAARKLDSLFAGLQDVEPSHRAAFVLKRYLNARQRDEESGCMLPSIVGEVATTASTHAPVLDEIVSEFAAALAERSHPPPRVSKRHLGLGLLALMIGGLTLSRALRSSPLSDEVLRACRAVGYSVLANR